MSQKVGWLERWYKGHVASILEVQYHRVRVKKTPRKKGAKAAATSYRDSELYYVLDKKIDLGKLSLTGNSVFAQKEVVEVELPVAKNKYYAQLRLLGKITRITTFMELKRIVFRGEVHFAAVNKEDFDQLLAQQNARIKEESSETNFNQKRSQQNEGRLKLTFKRD